MQMTDIAQTNLLTGTNGVGKTSVLEAIFLALNPVAHHVAWLVTHRQRPPFRTAQGTPPWRDLFPQQRPTNSLRIDVQADAVPHRWSVRLTEAEPKGAVPIAIRPDAQSGLALGPSSVSQAVLDVQLSIDDSEVSQTRWNHSLFWSADNSLQAFPTLKPPVPTGAYLAGYGSHEQDCAAFGAVQASGADQVQRLIEALQPIEPRLRRLLITVDPYPRLNADLGSEGGVMPLDLLGDGFRRAVTYMLEVLSCKAEVILIDEIENGLHYSHYAELWSTLGSFSKASGIQLFAVTHSVEFLRAALTPDDTTAAAWRLDRGKNGHVAVARFDGEDARAALSFGVELR